MKKDIKQIEDIAKEFGMTPRERQQFGKFLESEKESGQGGTYNKRGDFTYKELQKKAREFLEID
jgi:hypothetical protein